MIELTLPDGNVRTVTSAVIGRAPDRTGFDAVAVDDPGRSASKNHAIVQTMANGAIEIIDLGTTNGTSVTRAGVTVALSPDTPTAFPPPFQLSCGDVAIIVKGFAGPEQPEEATVPRREIDAPEPAPQPILEPNAIASAGSWWEPAPSPAVVELPDDSVAGLEGVAVPAESLEAVESLPRRAGSMTLAVRELVVETDGRRRLDRVDLDARGGEMIGILGTSGAGKSTLIKAIAGVDPASSGTILLDGVDVYARFDSLRHRIGYVPQDDILHPTLTIRETLRFAARLRLPETVTAARREARVVEVLDELGLTPRADAQINELSGGQRKRVNVAVELLTSPTLLILDEPTSGLDPGNERIAMELFRSLATQDRVVLVVTHSTDSLDLCDRVVLMGAGGIKVYDGHISKMSAHFAGRALNEIFAHLERTNDIESLRVAPFAPLAAHDSPPPPPPSSLVDRVRGADLLRVGRQFHILAERYIRVIESDRRNSIILASQAGVIAVLMLAVFAADSFEPGPNQSKSGNVLMALALASIYLGASNAIREVVKERPILQREMALGISPVAYLASKVIPLGAFTMVQATVLVVVGTLRQGQPSGAATFLPAMTEIFLIVATSGVSAVCLGLFISASSPSADRAMTILPVVLFAQLLLVGLIFPVSTIGVQQLAWLTSAYWSFGGAASTVDFESLYCSVNPDADCVWLWSRSAFNWVVAMLALCVLGMGTLFLAWRSIDRSDPSASWSAADVTATPTPGWYEDPERNGWLRRWDGCRWVDEWARTPTTPPPPYSPPPSPRPGHGRGRVAIIAASVLGVLALGVAGVAVWNATSSDPVSEARGTPDASLDSDGSSAADEPTSERSPESESALDGCGKSELLAIPATDISIEPMSLEQERAAGAERGHSFCSCIRCQAMVRPRRSSMICSTTSVRSTRTSTSPSRCSTRVKSTPSQSQAGTCSSRPRSRR